MARLGSVRVQTRVYLPAFKMKARVLRVECFVGVGGLDGRVTVRMQNGGVRLLPFDTPVKELIRVRG